jgi:hypothetical protein
MTRKDEIVERIDALDNRIRELFEQFPKPKTAEEWAAESYGENCRRRCAITTTKNFLSWLYEGGNHVPEFNIAVAPNGFLCTATVPNYLIELYFDNSCDKALFIVTCNDGEKVDMRITGWLPSAANFVSNSIKDLSCIS